MKKLVILAAVINLSLGAFMTGSMPASAQAKTHAIHVKNKSDGRIDFQISDGGKVLVESYLPIGGACAVFPTDCAASEWSVKTKKNGGAWSAAKSMHETNGWLELQ